MIAASPHSTGTHPTNRRENTTGSGASSSPAAVGAGILPCRNSELVGRRQFMLSISSLPPTPCRPVMRHGTDSAAASAISPSLPYSSCTQRWPEQKEPHANRQWVKLIRENGHRGLLVFISSRHLAVSIPSFQPSLEKAVLRSGPDAVRWTRSLRPRPFSR